jgi:hypothetical protein
MGLARAGVPFRRGGVDAALTALTALGASIEAGCRARAAASHAHDFLLTHRHSAIRSLTVLRRKVPMTAHRQKSVAFGLLLCGALLTGCHGTDPNRGRQPLPWSAWIEDTAVQRGHVQAGDVAQFGCPPGWRGIEETAAALRGRDVSMTYVGSDPPRHEGTINCVAQQDFAIPASAASVRPTADPVRRPLAPVWISTTADGIVIGFARELTPSAPIYLGQDTPCGPRLIGVELNDLLKWLADPSWGRNRHFLGMISGGCPERNRQ